MNALQFYQGVYKSLQNVWPNSKPIRKGHSFKINDHLAIQMSFLSKGLPQDRTHEFNAAVIDLDNGIIINSTKQSICVEQLDTFLEYVKSVA